MRASSSRIFLWHAHMRDQGSTSMKTKSRSRGTRRQNLSEISGRHAFCFVTISVSVDFWLERGYFVATSWLLRGQRLARGASNFWWHLLQGSACNQQASQFESNGSLVYAEAARSWSKRQRTKSFSILFGSWKVLTFMGPFCNACRLHPTLSLPQRAPGLNKCNQSDARKNRNQSINAVKLPLTSCKTVVWCVLLSRHMC